MESTIAILLLFFALFCVLIVVVATSSKKRIEQLQRYWDIKIGMSEAQMLNIMGGNFSRSLLKNNRIKYEWRINATSYGSSYKGISTRSYSGVKKVAIYTKNGVVEEVRPYNI